MEWLSTHGEQDPSSVQIRRLLALEDLGAQVMVADADVCDRARMQAVVEEAEARFGVIHGVIHAAGAVRQSLFRAVRDMSLADVQDHFVAKVKGVHVLEDVLRDRELDFCVLTSSLASLLGGLGLAAYSAANNFMDAFAYRHNQAERAAWLSINWDAWQFTARQYSASGNPFGEAAISQEEGAEVFLRILSLPRGTAAQVAVSSTRLQPRLEQWINHGAVSAVETAPAEAGSRAPRPNLASAYVAPRNEIEREIAEVWQATLGIQQVGVYDSFFELGGNSLVGVQLIANLSEKWSVQIPMVSLYEGPTVHALAKIISSMVAPATETEQEYVSGRSRGEKLRERRRRHVQEERTGTDDESE
jgi:acyl carrier protein